MEWNNGIRGFRYEVEDVKNLTTFIDFIQLLPEDVRDLITCAKGFQRITSKNCKSANAEWKGLRYNLLKESSMWRCIAQISEDLGGYRMAMIAWMSVRSLVQKPKKMTPEEGEYLATQEWSAYKRTIREIDENIERLKNLCLRKEDYYERN